MKYLTVLFIILFVSCKNEQTLKGTLHFKLVNLTSPDGMTQAEERKIIDMLDSVGNKTSNPSEELIVNYFKILQKNNILSSPFIRLKINEKETRQIFLSPNEYSKIKKYTLDYLINKNKKLELRLVVKKLDDSIYFSNQIINFEIIDGLTSSDK